jgi:uncharacterized membrane protein
VLHDDGSRSSGLPIWTAAFPLAAGAWLLAKAAERELYLQAAERNAAAVFETPYLHHPGLTRIHMVTGALLVVLGFIQFLPWIRVHRPTLHRWNGRAFIAVGSAAALSGVWMNIVFYQGAVFQRLGGYFFGVGVLVSAVLGFLAIRRGDVWTHREWMSRAMAVAIAAGLQRVFMEAWFYTIGPLDDHAIGFCLWMAAGIVLSLNELMLRRLRLMQSQSRAAE